MRCPKCSSEIWDVENCPWCKIADEAEAISYRKYEKGPQPLQPKENKVINFKPKEKHELVHGCDCGGQLFYIHSDGMIECRICGLKQAMPVFEK